MNAVNIKAVPDQKAALKETILVVMPVYNEETVIAKTLQEWIIILKSYPGSEILIINDGSTDKTSKILGKIQKKNKNITIVNQSNSGHGPSLIKGYRLAIKSKHSWIFQTDSDGSIRAKNFTDLWRAKDNRRIVLGRRLKRNENFFRQLITGGCKIWIFILFGKLIADPNIPFRLIKKEYLRQILNKIPAHVFAPNILMSIYASCGLPELKFIPLPYFALPKIHSNMRTIFKGAYLTFIEILKFRLYY